LTSERCTAAGDGVLSIQMDAANDPHGSKLQTVLEIHLAYERARAVRRRWLWFVAIVWGGTLVHWISAGGQDVPLPAWMLLAALRVAIALRAVLACVSEWQWHRRWSEAVSTYGGVTVS
jgi:hypothetical protein